MRNSIRSILLMAFIMALPAVRVAHADEVVLITGERFTSSRVWEENGKILFDMNGLIVSVGKAEVAAIFHGSSNATMPEGGADRPAQVQETPPPRTPVPSHSQEPSIHDPATRKPRARGIGLDGLAWQMKPTEIRGLEKLETDPAYGGIDQYGWQAGNLTLGDVLLDGLVFGFWQNKLYSIMTWVNGKPAYERLQQAVFDRYGPGHKNEKGLERYIWRDETTDRMLEFDAGLNTGIFWMRSKNLDQQIKRLYPNDGRP